MENGMNTMNSDVINHEIPSNDFITSSLPLIQQNHLIKSCKRILTYRCNNGGLNCELHIGNMILHTIYAQNHKIVKVLLQDGGWHFKQPVKIDIWFWFWYSLSAHIYPLISIQIWMCWFSCQGAGFGYHKSKGPTKERLPPVKLSDNVFVKVNVCQLDPTEELVSCSSLWWSSHHPNNCV